MMTVGIDLTDGGVRAVTVDGKGEVIGRSVKTPGSAGILAAVREAQQESRSTARDDAAPTGFVIQWPGDDLPEELTAALSPAPPFTIAAGPAMVIAEAWCGAGRGVRDLIAFTIGEHVSAGVIVGGELLRGAHGYAASVAWLALNPVEREDYRRYGGLEAEIAAAGIVRRLVWRIKSGDHSGVVEQVGGDLSLITAAQVFTAARSGDGVCVSVVRDTAKYVGMAISNLATILDPEAVILGGTLATSGDLMLDAIRVECARRLCPAQSERIRIVLSTLGADAAAIGAARAVGASRP
jgi:glucokinase